MKYELGISAGLHVALFAAALLTMSGGKPLKIEEASLPVDLLTPQEFSRIAKGETKAKPQDTPKVQADKTDAPKPQREATNQPVARHDAAEPPAPTPTPQQRPPDIDRAAEEAKAQALKEKAAEQARKVEAAKEQARQEQAQKDEADKRAAEQKAAQDKAMEQLIKDNLAAQQKEMEALAAQKRAEQKKLEKQQADARKAEQAKLDKLIQQKLAEGKEAEAQAEAQRKADAAAKAAQKAAGRPSYDVADVEKLLNKDRAARTARGGEVETTSSTGRLDAAAPKLSLSEQAKLARQIHDHIRRCWEKPFSPDGAPPSPAEVQFEVSRDGTLISDPRVVKYTNTPLGQAVARQGIGAVKRCLAEKPLELPQELYQYWANGEIGFDIYER